MQLRGHIIFIAALAAVLMANRAYAICDESTNVTSDVSPSGPNFTYEFFASNGCVPVNHAQHLLTEFFTPYFADAGISNIVTPSGWTYAIDPANDLFGLPGAGVLDFQSATPLGYSFTGGFSFTANYGGVKGPFAMNLITSGVGSTLFGDPLIPASPDTRPESARTADRE